MKQKAINTLIEFVTRRVSEAPASEQIELYQALATLMPTDYERAHAQHIAWVLSQGVKLQLDFNRQLFRGIKNNTQGDGDGHAQGDGE